MEMVHLGERDCSVPSKNQRLSKKRQVHLFLLSTPKRNGKAAVRAAKTVGYQNAGTIEFLVDERKNIAFHGNEYAYSVEHSITEMITELDLVQQQIKIAWRIVYHLPKRIYFPRDMRLNVV